MQQGFVTFADIMGWKGIWLRNQGNEDKILEELLAIKEKIERFIEIQCRIDILKNILQPLPQKLLLLQYKKL